MDLSTVIYIGIVYGTSVLFIAGVLVSDHLFNKYPNYYVYIEFMSKGLIPIYNTIMMLYIIFNYIIPKLIRKDLK